ncbi:SRPBCC family protein [Aurantibacillus circumpalustris]|uniref:SRPBCC family protein n=1 Tax=Aurantibacillus circumpalustris TaxID=3036359 RepID=UPI00295BA75B|nr:SRPBCC domain-containing protein [Aurantibacillus circumpalustris]
MKNFDWTGFSLKILVKAKLNTVYDAWTKSGEAEKWFLKKANYLDKERKALEKNVATEKGNLYEWSWYLHDVVERGRVLEANGLDHFQFTFAGDCIVDVKLSEKDGNVLVELSQKDIPTDEDSKKEVRLGCHDGWSFYLVNLKSICEGGLDLRNKNEMYKRMVNN